MRVFHKSGIHVQEGIKEVVLDPSRRTQCSVATHGHLDHLTSGAVMTPETRDIMKVRKRKWDGVSLKYGVKKMMNGLPITFSDAGHVFGSAMVRVGEILYTGDVNPEGGLTCGVARPEPCDVLIVEATYGSPRYSFPPKEAVMDDLLGWVESELHDGPVAIGAYEFGKAQEIIALLNRLDREVVVTDKIADLSDVCRKYGVDLRYRRFSELEEDERSAAHPMVVTRMDLKDRDSPEQRAVRAGGGKTAYVSGWCTVYDFANSWGLDAQFPISDHGDFDALIGFVDGCSPRKVYTCHGFDKELAREIEGRLSIPAEPIPKW
jgi:putative mRNA 3-end processing factor